jgi:hypothetical protein
LSARKTNGSAGMQFGPIIFLNDTIFQHCTVAANQLKQFGSKRWQTFYPDLQFQFNQIAFLKRIKKSGGFAMTGKYDLYLLGIGVEP